ncbi:hypothetical protein [Streptomyces sp. NBC_01268]|uniref:hypothetical protein n=1 Tax=unclassified Streptomyces TaxID=2593676 RepID=UPI002E32A897|nr:hypothetical protein [Streptomyces sp. NBC_01268]
MSEKPSVSDEEWASFVEAAREQGLGTEEQEKLLKKARPPKRSKPPKAPKPPKRQEPAGWRTGPAWQEMNGTARRRGRAKAALGITLVAALALVAVRPQLLTDHLPEGVTSALPSSWTDRPEDTTPLAAETARPTAAPDAVDPHRPTLKEPFKGSPALRWADGAAGIELPPAKAVGWMSKEQAATALKRSKAFLVAANLDPAVLRGGRPADALALVEPTQPARKQLEGWLARPTKETDPTAVFSRFSPSEVKLVGTVVKTRGRMTMEAGEGEQKGAVLVHVDYSFVYPLVQVRPGADEVTRTIVRREMVFGFYDSTRYRVTQGKLSLHRWSSDVGNSSCERDGDGFYHPAFQGDPATTEPGTAGPEIDPYDRTKGLDQRPKECGTVSRV